MFVTIKRGLLALFGLLALLVLLFNSFLVEPALGLVMSGIESRTGTRCEFASARGNLVTGSLTVEGLHLSREEDGRNQFDLKVGHVTADVSMLRLFDPEWRLDELNLTGVRGRFVTVPREHQEPGTPGSPSIFTVEQVRIEAAELTFVNLRDDGGEEPVLIEVDTMTVEDYRSHWSLYDLLFRSTVEGTVDGEPFTFTRRIEEKDQEVLWHLEDLHVGKWASMLSGPLSWVESGEVDVKVRSWWPVGDPRTIHQEWELRLSGARARRGEGSGLIQGTMAPMVVAWLSRSSGETPVTFTFDLPRDRFDGAQSLEDADLWEHVSRQGGEQVVNLATERITGGSLDDLGDRVRRLFGR